MNTKHHIGIEQDGTRFKATVADLGITVYGDTHQEAVQNAQDVLLSAHLYHAEVVPFFAEVVP